MPTPAPFIAALLAASLLPAPVPPGPSPTTLAALRDRARVLLLFAPSADDPRLLAQLESLRANAAQAQDRDLVPVAVPERGSSPTPTSLEPAEAAAARRRFGIRAGQFTAILVGKDGGEKLRSGKPFPFERLRAVIDAMPMRQEEMRAKAHRSA